MRSLRELSSILRGRRLGLLIDTTRNTTAGLFEDENYRIWAEHNEPSAEALSRQPPLSRTFNLQPKISIITPVFNPDKKVFIDMLESVVNQTYDNWELCLADASSESYTRKLIEEYKKTYPEKIRVNYLRENRGIAGNANEALSLATGDYIALLDHDDTLAPFAFYEVVKVINEHPEVDFLYSDRDIIYYDDRRAHPFFKPDWSPDYLLAQNYLCHINVFRKRVVEETGGFREGYDGSQDYDLLLRVTERTDGIIHIPKILYHWRVVPGSASVDPTAKPYAYDAAIKALEDSIQRRGWKGVVTHGVSKGFYEVQLEVAGNPKVSVVVLADDKSKSVRRCIDSILKKTLYTNYEIIVVDSLDKGNRLAEYTENPVLSGKVKVLEDAGSLIPSEMKNYAASRSDAPYLMFLDEKTEVLTGDWLEVMLGFSQRKESGAVGVKLIYPEGTLYSAGLILDEKGNVRRSHHGYPADSHGYNGRIQNIQNVSAISGCLMVRKEVFDEVGGFDPQFVGYVDVDFCLKLRSKNYLNVYEPQVELYYHEPLTAENSHVPQLRKESELLLQKWGHLLKHGDPYYNPNLTSEKEDFSIRM